MNGRPFVEEPTDGRIQRDAYFGSESRRTGGSNIRERPKRINLSHIGDLVESESSGISSYPAASPAFATGSTLMSSLLPEELIELRRDVLRRKVMARLSPVALAGWLELLGQDTSASEWSSEAADALCEHLRSQGFNVGSLYSEKMEESRRMNAFNFMYLDKTSSSGLQKFLGIMEDGLIGSVTLKAMEKYILARKDGSTGVINTNIDMNT